MYENENQPAPLQANRRRQQVIAGLVILAVILIGLGIKYGRHHLFPKRFAVVEPGKIYRSGQLEARPLEQVIDEYGIKTILVLLNDEPEDPLQTREKTIAAEKNVKIIRIEGMPGDGMATFDAIEKGADILADAKHYPILVHCAAGVNRTGAVCAAWRMKYCGWNADQAMQEAIACGYSLSENPEMNEHVREFYHTRVKPEATASPASRPADTSDESTSDELSTDESTPDNSTAPTAAAG